MLVKAQTYLGVNGPRRLQACAARRLHSPALSIANRPLVLLFLLLMQPPPRRHFDAKGSKLCGAPLPLLSSLLLLLLLRLR